MVYRHWSMHELESNTCARLPEMRVRLEVIAMSSIQLEDAAAVVSHQYQAVHGLFSFLSL